MHSLLCVEKITESQFEELTADRCVPIEQSQLWWSFESQIAGRRPWKLVAIYKREELWCIVRLTSFQGRGFRYLWGKEAPIWFVEPTANREEALVFALTQFIRSKRGNYSFLRIHTHNRLSQRQELLQSMSYDMTVIVDLTQDEEDILKNMRQRGRRNIRKAMRDESLEVFEETGLSRLAFLEVYQVLVETGTREGFGIHPESTYWHMLTALGAKNCRLFVTRREGRPLAWAMVTSYQGQGKYYYGASNAEGRKAWAADLLHWTIMKTLKQEQHESYDFMGTESDRAPGLSGVTEFKAKFVPSPVAVPGAWDFPIQNLRYGALTQALSIKRTLQNLLVARS